jgi:hypothetical protein
MKPVRILILSSTLVTLLAMSACRLTAVAVSEPGSPTLDGVAISTWSEQLEPAAEDRAWLEIPWHASFHAGLEAADAAERPLLLWLMNGHPLGCT